MSKRSGNSKNRSLSKPARMFVIISRCQAGASSQHGSSARARSSSVTTTISPVSGSKYDVQSSLAASNAAMISQREMTFDMASNTSTEGHESGAQGIRSLVQENYRPLPGPRSREPSHFSNSFPKTFWAHFGTDQASFISSPA